MLFCCYRQMQAYESRISDWRSDVSSSNHARAVARHFGAVVDADFFQHPAHDAASGLGVGVEDEFVAVVGHARIPAWKGSVSLRRLHRPCGSGFSRDALDL